MVKLPTSTGFFLAGFTFDASTVDWFTKRKIWDDDDEDEWNKMEAYISKHSGVEFSHGLCPDCVKQHYPDYIK